MHTFFINTSGKELENYSEIFEIQRETRRLVSLECPLTDWNSQETGYKALIHKMGDLIDNYKDINNDFNLILYIDLLSYEEYTAIPMSKHRERYACLKALRSILRCYISSTLVEELKEFGRTPQEVLLIFEENQLPEDEDDTTEDGKNLIRSYTRAFLGLPTDSEVDGMLSVAKNCAADSASAQRLCLDFAERSTSCISKTILNIYEDQIDTFVKEAKSYSTSEQALKHLLDNIVKCGDSESVFSVSFITNRRAGVSNKQEKTRRNLRLCFYLMSCVKEETVLNKNISENENQVKQFPPVDWDEIAIELSARGYIYKKKYNETQRLSESFSEMNLAPSLLAFDHQRFGFDEYGKRAKSFDLVDSQDQKDDNQESQDLEESIVRPDDNKSIVVNEVDARSIFSQNEYPLFDYNGDNFDQRMLGKKATVDQYVAEAKKLRRHHLDYLQRLKVHVSDRLSNYAGRSAENDPALLRKRKVSVAEADFEDDGRDYRYAKADKSEETKKLKTIEDISETAYTSAIIDYMEFCAGRSVAVTDIEQHSNWFVTRVHQIEESLRMLYRIAIGMLIAVMALYIPFVLIQWESIIANPLTVTTALLSVLIPIGLLYVVFAIVCNIQRKKFLKAWIEFKEKSDMILKENALAAEKYDKLLSVYIPTLRWVYEYKLDVEFYSECCKMARAKIAHHIQKLHDRVVTIGNIIEDLESDAPDSSLVSQRASNNHNNEIDYNVSFCTGDKNCKFYSIIDEHFLESTHK